MFPNRRASDQGRVAQSLKRQDSPKLVPVLTLMTTNPFFLSAEHCMGKVSEAPASAPEKSKSSVAMVMKVGGGDDEGGGGGT